MNCESATSVRMLGDADLRALELSPAGIVDAIEEALHREMAGQVWTSPKSSLYSGDGRYMMTTLSASDTPPVSVVKFVMVSPDNPQIGLPSINGSIMLHDSRTGALLAILDANWITEVRTAGLSAVVARRLADPTASRIAFVGAGAQARSHLETFAALFPLTDVMISSRGRSNIDRLAALAREKGLQVTICDQPRDAVELADLIVTSVPLTAVGQPFLDADWLKPGAFAAITDTGVPWRPETLGAFGRVVIDDTRQEAASATKMVAPEFVSGDLHGLLSDKVAQGHDATVRTAFIFRGLAIGDFAISALAWQACGGELPEV